MTKNARPAPRAIAIALILMIIAVFVGSRFYHRANVSFYPSDLGRRGPCPGKKEVGLPMTDAYLPGLIEKGQLTEVVWNWYACHPPMAGEVALVRVSRGLPPKARVIRGVPGDTIAILRNPRGPGWILKVNGAGVLDSQGKPYYFGGEAVPPIGRYLEMRGKKLGAEEVIALSTRSPGDGDSGQFGALGLDDLVAKVTPTPR